MTEKPGIKTILLDMDGVLWRGNSPVVDIRALFGGMQDAGFQAYCVTNNSTKSVSMYQEALAGFGVDLDQARFITSAEGTADYLDRNFPPGARVYLIGEEGLRQTLQDHGFTLAGSGQDAAAVVVGLDRDLSYQKLDQAVRGIQDGAAFIATNPDRTLPTPAGPAPGAGAIVAAVAASCGIEPIMIGKPASPLFELALARAQSKPEETLMVGDRLETDILGAQRAGIRTCLVLSGVATSQQASSWRPALDCTAEDALVLLRRLVRDHGQLV